MEATRDMEDGSHEVDNKRVKRSASNEKEAAREKSTPFLPPCRVCNSQASGFHYGVNTCEACKGFFRRSLARDIPYAECSNDGACSVELEGRNSCPACRLKKCISVGMSKSAIKTGRYTHEKRTMDTIEVKGASSKEPQLASMSSSAAADERTNSSTATSYVSIALLDACFGDIYSEIIEAFRVSFADTAYIYENMGLLEDQISELLKQNSMSELKYVIATRGDESDVEKRQVEKITEQNEILKSFEQLNSSLTGDLIYQHPEYLDASKQLYECWSVNVDRFIHSAVLFAKKLPGFQQLPVADQVKLIKYGRAEIASLVKFRHFNNKFDAFIDYHTETKSLYVFPNKLLQGLFLGKSNPNSSNHQWIYERTMRHMHTLNLQVENVAILCAISIFSPDRDTLSVEAKELISKIQQQFISLLEFSLNQTHKDKAALARFLLLLPLLRELNELNDKALMYAQQRLQPELSPLLQEVLPKSSD